MRIHAFLIFSLVSAGSFSQEKPILVFDLRKGTTDTIASIEYDPNILSENTPYSTGCYNSTIEPLITIPPDNDVFPGSQFTRKKRASVDFDLNKFPIRTSVKLFYIDNDTLKNHCSGSLISKRHVLTAAHCVSPYQTNELIFDSLYAAPIYDNGEFNTTFSGSAVSKIHFFKDWSLNGTDIAILELEEPIGERTGWISIGFNSADEELMEGIFYKFSYPVGSFPIVDPDPYNGDSLFYAYGVVDNFFENRLSITNATGAGGDSGSSIIKVVNEEEYTTYGVLSTAANISHNRINNWRYYAFKSIIGDDLFIADKGPENDIIVYPNPADDRIWLKNIKEEEVLELNLYDSMGRKCYVPDNFESCLELNVAHLVSGTYFLSIRTAETTVTKRVIKSSR